jgi:hypothetical protein
MRHTISEGGVGMSVFMTETYVVRRDKQREFDALLEEFLAFKTQHAGLFEDVRSWTLRRQEIGAPAGLYAETWEYESLAAMEQAGERIFSDEGMKAISEAFHALLVPATFASSVWTAVA